jgi:hypothetical protein
VLDSYGREQTETKTMTNTVKLVAAAAAVGLTLCGALSEASARRHSYGWQENLSRSYRPPKGQIWERAFRNGRTPEQRERQDFQLDGEYQ